ncbi:flagellar hook capping FlgD N-terminal domain-containing protein [Fervidibacillus albus]|uniref:Basal-body rod modification protein FlgD n=1 Tax=Fervidibacillus albus TaxID=2980026 RepID=A0A9E8LW01_9BACI|nr:flagellar hook capping FlgD N-terminal domain-containing protein [Fervidibacillus albus]WAA10718.1 flagellar hook assembly protein FlgD [Fervidibacillus albus]
MVNSIDTNLLLSSVQQETNSQSNTIGKDTFLKLFMAQLQNQDPLNPLEDKDFIEQMATFTSVEQLMDMNEALESILQAEQENQQIGYLQLVGKDVLWHKISYSEDGDLIIDEGTGNITSIYFAEDGPLFYLEDGTELAAANITEIQHTSNENSIVQASYLIGKEISWNNNGNEENAIVASVIRKEGNIYFQLDDGANTVIRAEDILSVTSYSSD